MGELDKTLPNLATKSLLSQLYERQRNSYYQNAKIHQREVQVYERLYENAANKKDKLQKQQKLRNDPKQGVRLSVKKTKEISDRIYLKGITSKALKILNADQKRSLEAKSEFTECTFSPNPHSKKRLSNKKQLEISNRLIKSKLAKEARLDLIRSMKLQSEIESCTFKPKTNRNSHDITVSKGYHQIVQPNLNWSRDFAILSKTKQESQVCSTVCSPTRMISPLSFTCSTSPKNKEKYELLYEESRERKKRKESIYLNILAPDCTFQPKFISKRPSCHSQVINKTDKTYRNVCEIDPSTATTTKKKSSLSSIVRFHTMALDFWERRRVLSEQSRVSSPSISQKSIKITEQRKQKIFEQIFELLDSDKDGFISADLIDCKSLQNDIVKLIGPIYNELELMEEGISKQQFCSAMGRLYQVSIFQDLIG